MGWRCHVRLKVRLRSSTSEQEQLTYWEQEAGEPVLIVAR